MPEQQFDEIRRNKLEEIMTHDTRAAVDMEVKKTGYDTDYYSINKTKEDIRFISSVLRDVDAGELNLPPEQVSHLRTVESRNWSHFMVNQQKFTGDSGFMKDVKDNVERLEKMLTRQTKSGISLDDVEHAYGDAIAACRTYRDNKNPWFPKGIARKRMVVSRLEALERELDKFRNARAAVDAGLVKMPGKIMDFLDIADNIPGQQEVQQQEQQEPVVVEQQDPVVIEEQLKQPVVEEKKEEEKKEEEKKEEEKKEEEKKVSAESVQIKLKDCVFPTQRKKDEANKALEEHKKDLRSRMKEPDVHIMDQAMYNNEELKELLSYMNNNEIRDMALVKLSETGNKYHPYEDLWKEWKPLFERIGSNSGNYAKNFDDLKKIIQKVYKKPVTDYGKDVAGRILKKLDEMYEENAKDCPLISKKEMDDIINKLSGTDMEQKQAVTVLQKYSDDIKNWGEKLSSKPGYRVRGLGYELTQICTCIDGILYEQRILNPVIFTLTEEEVAVYQENKELEEAKQREEEAARRKELEELEKEQKKLEAELAANEEKLKTEESAYNKQAEADQKEKAKMEADLKAKEKAIKEKEELRRKKEAEELEELEKEQKKLEAELAANEEKLKAEENAYNKQSEADQKKKAEMEANLKAKEKAIKEKEEARKKEELEKKKQGTLTQDEAYALLKSKADTICKKGFANRKLASQEGYSDVQQVLLPLLSDEGCTWDALIQIVRMGIFAEVRFDEEGFEDSALGRIREECLLPLMESGDYKISAHNKINSPIDKFFPTEDVINNTKLKFKADGRVVLPEETRKRIALEFTKLSPQEKEMLDKHAEYNQNAYEVFFKYKEKKYMNGSVEQNFGPNYIEREFMSKMIKNYLKKNPKRIS